MAIQVLHKSQIPASVRKEGLLAHIERLKKEMNLLPFAQRMEARNKIKLLLQEIQELDLR